MGATIVRSGPLAVIDYHCDLGPADRPYPEVHSRYSLSYVRRGSFGCRTRGNEHRLLAGGFLIGQPGDEFTCTHEHHDGGDECISIQLTPEFLSAIAGDRDIWRWGALPPNASLAALGELAQASLMGQIDVDLREAALLVVGRFLMIPNEAPPPVRVNARLSRIICRTADWIDANSAAEVDLLDAAREAELSPYHFLRSFHAALGLTPHQHLVRCRLRKAAKALLETDTAVTGIALDVGFADLSNFVRSFRRAAGVSPGRFRRLSRADRNNFKNLRSAER